ncbi:hypothetical protein L211DRAFT_34206 [Terfezia boudieri ATCC MYA-4762]|uniref:Uncharacterized protein n=1 Tax=Terfezia boudieri ATCC MYA-4762 TaxID=1051890 RepID=A0A3N4M7K4_9PEZI|nr:hypothetical protein L211DRAFT_34206 [Terfezia boudieri ATCC MYA-4762]
MCTFRSKKASKLDRLVLSAFFLCAPLQNLIQHSQHNVSLSVDLEIPCHFDLAIKDRISPIAFSFLPVHIFASAAPSRSHISPSRSMPA